MNFSLKGGNNNFNKFSLGSFIEIQRDANPGTAQLFKKKLDSLTTIQNKGVKFTCRNDI